MEAREEIAVVVKCERRVGNFTARTAILCREFVAHPNVTHGVALLSCRTQPSDFAPGCWLIFTARFHERPATGPFAQQPVLSQQPLASFSLAKRRTTDTRTHVRRQTQPAYA